MGREAATAGEPEAATSYRIAHVSFDIGSQFQFQGRLSTRPLDHNSFAAG